MIYSVVRPFFSLPTRAMIMHIVSIISGYAVWTVIFLGGSAVVRSTLSEVHDAEGLTTENAALFVYLVVSVFASLAAGYMTARISKIHQKRDVWILAIALLATGIPVQLGVWDVLPVWYNSAFLILLVPCTLLGATFYGRQSKV